MDAAESLFHERCGLDSRRQPAREVSEKELVATWKALFPGTMHPYGMASTEKGALAKASPHFGGGSAGRKVALSTSHIYALTGVPKMRFLAGWRSTERDETIHDQLIAAAGTPRRWIPLAPHVRGPFESFRKFTWWTTWDITAAGQPFVAGRRLGLIDSWIPELALILRCRFEPAMATVCVPTGCDAFDGPVFEAMLDSNPSGRTINLNTDPFTPGEPEYAVTSLAADRIDVFPVRIGPTLRRSILPAVLEDDGTWNRLAAYYRAGR
jgi:hypothetical protein